MTEEQCLERIRQGGREMEVGARDLFGVVAQPMLRFFCSQGLSAHDAEDVMQESLLKICMGATSFSAEGSAKSWIWQVARNCLVDHFRKNSNYNSRRVPFDDDDWGRIPSAMQLDDGRKPKWAADECVNEGIARFRVSAPDRVYVLTLQMDGVSIEDIAARIGRSTAATKEYLSQCKKKLAPFVQHCMEYLEESSHG